MPDTTKKADEPKKVDDKKKVDEKELTKAPNKPVDQKTATPDPSVRDPKQAVSKSAEAARDAEAEKALKNRPPDQADIEKEADLLKEKRNKAPRTKEEERSGEAVQPPTPVNQVISHQPGQANGPNQADQARTDQGIWKEPK